MLAVNSQFWIQKCSFPRYLSGVLSRLAGLQPETPSPHRQRCVSERGLPDLPRAQSFHRSAAQHRNLLMKMLEKKKKRRWYDSPKPLPIGQSVFLNPTKKKKDQHESKRVRTLNVIVYKAVVDLLASHEVNPDLHSYSLNITKASYTVDYSFCRIYWTTSLSTDSDSKIQQLLDRSAPRIRHLLMSLQILSNVPPLVFVRDKKYAALKEVEKLLEIADYGPSEDVEDLCLGEEDDTRLQSLDHVEKKRTLWFNLDHDALYKQIEDYKHRSRDCSLEITSSPGLTQEQLALLAEIRKKKLIEKKKKKSKKLRDDDDISPKDFLLARQIQLEEEQHSKPGLDDSQVSELAD